MTSHFLLFHLPREAEGRHDRKELCRGRSPSSAQPSPLLPRRRVSAAWPEDQADSSPQCARCLFQGCRGCVATGLAALPQGPSCFMEGDKTMALRGGEVRPKLLPEERTCLARHRLLPTAPACCACTWLSISLEPWQMCSHLEPWQMCIMAFNHPVNAVPCFRDIGLHFPL